MLMHKILQTQLLSAIVANLKIDTIYALYPESFFDQNLAVQKVFTFSDSAGPVCPIVRFLGTPALSLVPPLELGGWVSLEVGHIMDGLRLLVGVPLLTLEVIFISLWRRYLCSRWRWGWLL